jgi:hypothetical protein
MKSPASLDFLPLVVCCVLALMATSFPPANEMAANPAGIRAQPPSADAPANGLADTAGFLGFPEVAAIPGAAQSLISLQNVFTAAVNSTITTTTTSGVVSDTQALSLAPGIGVLYSPPPGFTGSAQVEAGASTFGVNLDLSAAGRDAYLGLAWNGESAAGLQPFAIVHKLFVPWAARGHNGWHTVFAVSNLGLSSASVQVSFYNPAGVPLACSQPFFIQPAGSRLVDLSDPGLACLGDDFIGSAVLAADQPVTIANVREEHPALGLRSYYPVPTESQLSSALVAGALFKASDAQTSELCVQNTGTLTAPVNVAYSDGVTTTVTLAPAASDCFDQGSEPHAAGWSGGAIVTSTTSLAGVVNVTALSGAAPIGRWSYAMPNQADIQSAAALPLLLSHYQAFTSVIHVYNFGGSPTTVTARYTGHGQTEATCPADLLLPAGGSATLSLAGVVLAGGLGTGYLNATAPIAVVVSARNGEAGSGDSGLGYSAAYPTQPISVVQDCVTTTMVFLPLVRR